MLFIIFLFLIWRAGLFFTAWLGSNFLSFSPRFPYSEIFLTNTFLPSWIWSFANFDGVHYLTIAKSGYSAQFTQVFFPLYPLLIKIMSLLFPFIPLIITGIFISNIFFFFSLIVIYKLLIMDYKKSIIKWVILFLIFFPTSFYFGSLYTESLFLFLTLSSFYFARSKRWWLAGFLGGLASATRLVGIFLLPALLWEGYMEKFKINKPKVNSSSEKSKLYNNGYKFLGFSFSVLRLPVLYTVPLGLLIYMVYLQIRFGDALFFWHVQPVFGAERSGDNIVLLPQVFWRYIKILTSVPVLTEVFLISILELIAVISGVFLLIWAHIKNIRVSYLIFGWLSLLTPTLTGTFSSMLRYILIIFPIFLSLGLIKSSYLKFFLLFVFSLLSAVLVILFTRGHWVA